MKIDRCEFKIKKWDWLLIIGLTLAPMTLLRIWKIGPGEALCFIWLLKYCNVREIKVNFYFRFFSFFILSMIFGSGICYFIAPKELRITDLLTWLFLAVFSIIAFQYFLDQNESYIKKFLRYFSIASTIWFFSLYLYSILLSQRIFGVLLWYHSVRFTGGANNPHQLAALNCALIVYFIVELLFVQEYKLKDICFNTAFVLMNAIMLVATQSSTGYMAVFISLSVVIYIFISRFAETKREKSVIFFSALSGVLLVCLIFHSYIYNAIYDWISTDANGIDRFRLFSHIGETFWKSPIFGLGPGSHSINRMEYHNTYLEIIAAGGIIGFYVLVDFSVNLFKRLSKKSIYLPIVIVLYAYGVAGFIMRRLIFWGIVTLICTLADKDTCNIDDKKNDNKFVDY